MVIQRLRFCGAICAASVVLCTFAIAEGDAADGPNLVTESDFSAGQLVDSLFEPELQTPRQRKARQPRSKTRRRAALRGQLVDNPNAREGLPDYALVNSQGQVLRYIQPVDEIDLEVYLGETVAVRRDTGRILPASQLALPKVTRNNQAKLSAFEDEPTPADEAEPIPVGEPEEAHGEESVMMPETDQGPILYDEGYEEGYGGEVDFGGCVNCGSNTCSAGGACAGRGVMYAHGEYLMWWFQGMETPPLVVADSNGNFSNPDTIVYGGSPILEDVRYGGRLTLGLWLDESGIWGIEGDYLGFGEEEEVFRAGGNNGNPGPTGLFIGRPFFNTVEVDDGIILVPRGPRVEDVDTQNLDGFVTVTTRSKFQTAGIRLRHSLCCAEACGNIGCGNQVACGSAVNCGSGVGGGWPFGGPLGRLCKLIKYGNRRTDVLYGVRWASLDESLRINENLEVVDGNADPIGTTFDVNDNFDVDNDFFGGDVGFMMEWERQRWSLQFLSKVAIGNTRQRVTISGSTSTNNGAPVQGGLLTQTFDHPTDGYTVGNIGTYERDEFSMIPEIGATLGYYVTPRFKLTLGYTMLYWSNIVRPGDQIDIDINGNLIPRVGGVDPDTIVPLDHPRFAFRQTDLWAHGINLGGEYRW